MSDTDKKKSIWTRELVPQPVKAFISIVAIIGIGVAVYSGKKDAASIGTAVIIVGTIGVAEHLPIWRHPADSVLLPVIQRAIGTQAKGIGACVSSLAATV